MFCGRVFTEEARRTNPNWSSVADLKERYGKSFVTTLRRYVEHGPDWPMAMMVNTPVWSIQPENGVVRFRHFVTSERFSLWFGNVAPINLLEAIDDNTTKCAGGPAANFLLPLEDDNGDLHEFHCESFNNTYDILTLFSYARKCKNYR